MTFIGLVTPEAFTSRNFRAVNPEDFVPQLPSDFGRVREPTLTSSTERSRVVNALRNRTKRCDVTSPAVGDSLKRRLLPSRHVDNSSVAGSGLEPRAIT